MDIVTIIAIVCAVALRDDIYEWLTSEFSDDNYIDDDDNDNLEEEQ